MAKREWWFVAQSNGTYMRFETNPHWVTADVKVHVIEHSELERAEALIAKLEAALKEASEFKNCDDVNGMAGEISFEALQLIKEWRGAKWPIS